MLVGKACMHPHPDILTVSGIITCALRCPPYQQMPCGVCMQQAASIARRHPSTMAIPIVFFGLMLGLGIWGVIAAASDATNVKRTDALNVAAEAAAGFEVRRSQASHKAYYNNPSRRAAVRIAQLHRTCSCSGTASAHTMHVCGQVYPLSSAGAQAPTMPCLRPSFATQGQLREAYAPANTLDIMIKDNPAWSRWNATFPEVAAQLLAKTLPGAIFNLQLAPFGQNAFLEPPRSFDRGQIGRDLLNDPERRPDLLQIIASGTIGMNGPYFLRPQNFTGVFVRHPIFISKCSWPCPQHQPSTRTHAFCLSQPWQMQGHIAYGWLLGHLVQRVWPRMKHGASA